MAEILDTDQKQKDSKTAPTTQLGGEKSSTLGESVGSQTQTPTAGGSTQQKGSGMGSRMSNLRKYIETNRDSGMAGKITKGIEDIQTNVGQQITSSNKQLKSDVSSENTRLDRGQNLIKSSNEGGAGLFEQGNTAAFTQDITPQGPAAQSNTAIQPQAMDGTSNQTQMNGTTGTSIATPQKEATPQVQQEVAPTPDYSQYGATATDRLDAFNQYKAGDAQQYQIQNEADIQSNIENLQTQADKAKTESGRFELLRDTFQRPGYTTGQQKLDQLILQAAPEQAQQLKGMGETITQPVEDQLAELRALQTTEQGSTSARAKELSDSINLALFGEQGLTQDAATGLVTDVGGQLGDFSQSITDKKFAAATDIGTQFNELKQKMQAGESMTTDDFAKLGVSDPERQQEMIDYYSKGANKTIAEKLESGEPYSTADMSVIGKAIGVDPETIQAIQNQQPASFDDFVFGKEPYFGGTDIQEKKYTYRDEVLKPQYEQYKNDIETNKTALNDLIAKAASNESIGAYREAPEVDYTQYLNALSSDQLTADSVASQEDFARQQALSALAGVNYGPLTQSGEYGNYADLGAGDFNVEEALNMAYEKYNPAKYAEMSKVSVPDGNTKTYGESVSDELDRTGTNIFGDNRFGESVGAALSGGAEDFTSGATDIETGLGDLLSGEDVWGGTVDTAAGLGQLAMGLTTAPVIGSIAGAEKLLTGGDSITTVYSNTKNAIKNVFKGKSFWCTEMNRRGLVSREDLDTMHNLMYISIPFKAKFWLWYLDNGPRLIDIANEMGYDWENAVVYFEDTLKHYNNKEYKKGIETYGELAVEICKFTNTEIPYHCDGYSLTNLLYVPKVIFEYGKLKMGLR